MSAIAPSLEQLAARLDALEQQLAVDNITPTYLTTNPDGTVSADFSGKIHAGGLTLDESGFGYDATSAAVWGTPDASAGEFIQGAHNGNHHQLNLEAVSQPDTHFALLLLDSDADDLPAESLIQVQADGASAVLLDSNGESNFMRLAGAPQQLAAAVGSSTVKFSGSGTSSGTTIDHGLGRLPKNIQITLQGGFGAIAVIAAYVTGITAVSFDIQAVSNVALNATVAFYWEAEG